MKILQLTGYKNAGKTTLACEIVRMLAAEGLRVGTVKRDAHDRDPEPEGADTRRHREAGASFTALASHSRTLWIRERPSQLAELLAAMEAEGADAVVIEGFKEAPYPKLVLLRSDDDNGLLSLERVEGVVLRGRAPEAEAMAAAGNLPVFRTDGMNMEALMAFLRPLMLE
jgi:molybdopterin-guanine dinucleotide biosynthesis protein B